MYGSPAFSTGGPGPLDWVDPGMGAGAGFVVGMERCW